MTWFASREAMPITQTPATRETLDWLIEARLRDLCHDLEALRVRVEQLERLPMKGQRLGDSWRAS